MPALAESLRRRWLLVLALLGLAASAALGVRMVVPPDYQARATVLMVPPEAQDDPGGNRYLLLGGLTPARDIVIQSLDSDTLRHELTAGTATTYDVSQDFTTSTPFVVLTATGPDPGAAGHLLDRLVDEVPHILTDLQDEIATGTGVRITSVTVSQDAPERVGKKQVRAVVVAVGGVLVIGLLLIGLLDRLLQRPRRGEGLLAPGGAGTGPEPGATGSRSDEPLIPVAAVTAAELVAAQPRDGEEPRARAESEGALLVSAVRAATTGAPTRAQVEERAPRTTGPHVASPHPSATPPVRRAPVKVRSANRGR